MTSDAAEMFNRTKIQQKSEDSNTDSPQQVLHRKGSFEYVVRTGAGFKVCLLEVLPGFLERKLSFLTPGDLGV